MKIYDWHIAPNPRRLHIYLAEKGLEIPLEEVGGDDLKLKSSYVAKYPHAVVPVLEFDDGHCQVNDDSAAVSTIWGKTATPVAQHIVVHFGGFHANLTVPKV